MANVKITELTAETNPASTDVLPIVDVSANVTKKVSVEDLLRNAPDGTAGAPSIANAGDQDTGIFFPAEGSVGVSTNSTQRLVVDSSGNVGIGTSSPSTRFHLTGTDNNFITLAHATRTGSWTISHSGSNSESLDFQQNNGSTTVRSYLAGRDIHEFHTNGSERLRIDSSGRVGIGVSSPGEKLTLGGEANPTIRIHTSEQGDSWSSSSEYGKLQWFSNDYEYFNGGEMASISVGVSNNFGTNPSIRFKTTSSRATGAVPTEHMRLDSIGRLGLGTASPADSLHISGSATTRLKVESTAASSYPGVRFTNPSRSYDIQIDGPSSSLRVFDATASSERLRIDSSGQVGVGTSSPLSRLHIVGGSATTNTGATVLVDDNAALAANIGGSIAFRGTDGTDVRTYGLIRGGKLNSGSGSFDGYLAFETRNNGQANTTERMRLTSAGQLGLGVSNPTAKLHVSSSSTTAARISSSSSTSYGQLQLQSSNQFLIGYGGAHSSQPNQLSLKNHVGDITFFTNLVERMRLNSSGNLLVGTTSTVGTDSIFQVSHSNFTNIAELSRTANDFYPANLNLTKNRGSVTSIVQNNDTIGSILFRASDGVDMASQAGSISCAVDGTPGANDMPGRLVFSTCADGASSPSERMRIDSSGRLGLASTSPLLNFQVVDYGGLDGNANELLIANNVYYESGNKATKAGYSHRIDLNNQSGYIRFLGTTTSASGAGAAVSLQEKMRIDSSGNVGIGTTSADARLHAQINTSTGNIAKFAGSHFNRALLIKHINDGINFVTTEETDETDADRAFIFSRGATETMRIDGSGRLLIGQTSTSAASTLLLENNSLGTSRQGILLLARGEATPDDGDALGTFVFTAGNHDPAVEINARRDGGTWTAGSSQPTRLEFFTTDDSESSPTERMRIGRSGQFSLYSEGALARTSVVNSGTSASSAAFDIRNNATSTTTGTQVFAVRENGDIYTSGNTTVQSLSSERRLKENIEVIDPTAAWTTIKNTPYYSYNYIGQEGLRYGPIVDEVPADMVRDTDLSDDQGPIRTFDNGMLHARLYSALQQAIAKIETLEAKVAALEAQ